jgi:hypothetical protein
MKLATKFIAAASMAAVLASSGVVAHAGDTFKEKIVVEEVEETSWWNAALSTGWDSLYMFRGVNILRGDKNYGSSLYWTDLNVTFNLSENDFLNVGAWVAFGIGDTNYKEVDAYATYTHTFGNLSLNFGYIMYAILSETYGLYSHELNTSIAYDIEIGPVTITPAIAYFFNLGPNFENRGFAEQCSSYLEARVDANIPLYGDVIALAPWTSIATNFRYNLTERGDDPPNPFVGANNFEVGISLPIQVNDVISVAPYGAMSYQWNELVGTRPITFWGGGSVTFAF